MMQCKELYGQGFMVYNVNSINTLKADNGVSFLTVVIMSSLDGVAVTMPTL